MKGKGRRAAIAAGIICAAVVIAGWPVLRDLARDAWWIHRLRAGSEEEKAAAIEKLAELRSRRALGALAEAFGTDVAARERILYALVKTGPRGVDALLAVPAAEPRLRAVELLARDVLLLKEHPELLGRLARAVDAERDPGMRLAMARAFLATFPRLGAVRAAVLEALRSPDPGLRKAAVEAARQAGGQARFAAPAILDALRDPATEVRAAAIASLPDIAAATAEIDLGPTAAASLAALLTDPRAEAAWWFLVRAGPSAAPAVPTLVRLLESDEHRIMALQALAGIGPAAAPAIPAIVRILQDRRGGTGAWDAAIRALAEMGAEARAAGPVLIDGIRPGKGRFEERQRRLALIAISSIAAGDREAAAVLIEILGRSREDDFIRAIAAEGLGRMGLPAEALPVLREALRSGSSSVRRGAAFGLAGLGPAAAGAIPDLRRAIGDRDGDVRVAAAIALWRVGRDGAALPVLRELTEVNPEDGMAVFVPAGGGEADRVLAGIAPLSLRENHRPAVAEALAAIGAPAVPALLRQVAEGQDRDRLFAIRVLGAIGPAAAEAVPALRAAAAREDDEEIAGEAAAALAKIAPPGAGPTAGGIRP